MPIFEYICRECEKHFEVLVQGSNQPICPSCNSDELEKKMSGFAVGGNSVSLVASEPAGPCSTCGDPRGAGACAWGG